MEKDQRDERRRQEDVALNRGLIWVGGAILLELLLIMVNKYYINFSTGTDSINLALAFDVGLHAARIIAVITASAALVWMILRFSRSGHTATLPPVMLAVSGILFAFFHIILCFKAGGVRMLFLLVPAWAALALVYYLYQREFFFSAFYTGMGAVGLWLLRHRDAGSAAKLTTYVLLGLMVVLLVAGAVVLFGLKKHEGVLHLLGREVRVLPQDAGYSLILLTFLVNAAALAAAAFLGGTVAYYLIYLLVAWLFALLVYYTVKMM